MRFVLLLLPAILCGQDAAVDRGARLFRTQCAVPYCHGPEGTAGRAPQLIGHTQSINSIYKIITWGIPGTGMPEFTTRLKSEEIADLVAYVTTLRGSAPAPAPATSPRVLTPEAKEGRTLFFDSARLPSCAACHEMDGLGVPVSPMTAGANRVSAVRVSNDPPFPAIVDALTGDRVRVYDLTGPLPVLRTLRSGELKLEKETAWRHADATRNYTAAELEKITRFLAR